MTRAIALLLFIALFALSSQQTGANVQTSAKIETTITKDDTSTPTNYETPTVEHVIRAYTNHAVDKSDLFIRNVPIESAADAKLVADAIASTPTLERFVLTKNGQEEKGHVLKDEVVAEIASGLAKSPKIRVVGFTKNSFASENACTSLGSLLSRPENTIQKFYLYKNEFTNAACLKQIVTPFIVDHVEHQTNHLRKIVIIDNTLDAQAVELVTKWIESPALNITELILRNVGLDQAGAVKLAQSLASPKNNLQKLDISENKNIGLDGFRAIAASVATNEKLEFLEIANISLTSQDAFQALHDMITKSKSLYKVDLSENKISDDAAQVLVSTLNANPSLSKLDISGSNLTAESVVLIADALEKNNTNLSRLNIYRIEIVDEVIQKRIISLDKVIKSDYFETSNEEEDEDDEEEVDDEDDDEDEDDDDDEDDEDDDDDDDDEEEEDTTTEEDLRAHEFLKKISKPHDEL